MLSRLFRKKDFRLYLGNIYVAERSDIKRILDQPPAFLAESINSQLHRKLIEVFELPLAKEVDQFADDDLAIDVIIPKYQGGALLFGHIGGTPLPLFWRPKVQIVSHIYNLKSGKILSKVKVTSKTPWKAYLGRVFSIRAIFSFSPLFTGKDLEQLLCESCLRAMAKHQAKF
ncbi:hypothetical protein ACWJJH_03550 [Endozoicomonadaceae bacterium StTr2]